MWVLFEVLNVYFIMPMPGSQEFNSIDAAYFLYTHRWIFRIAFIILILIGLREAFTVRQKWIPSIAIVFLLIVVGLFNFKLVADHMFRQAHTVLFKSQSENIVPDSSIVIAIQINGEAKAYPIRFLAYHHQVRDTVGGEALMITYCSVCRTGRVFRPVIDGEPEQFRLVGMDHYNAMFEDARTGSWWRQATGVAVAGPLKGHFLPELDAPQYVLKKWFTLYPTGKVMQPDPDFRDSYDSGSYEYGKDKSRLTRRDTASWKDKSWVIGIETARGNKAFDWNDLVRRQVINDYIDSTPIVVALGSDRETFAVYERPMDSIAFTLRNDTLLAGPDAYDLAGRSLNHLPDLKRLDAHQEYWHSWRTFHPLTDVALPAKRN